MGVRRRSISVPTAIWAGGQDVTVPYAHGRWLAAHVPGAIAHLFDDAGHITVVNDLEDVLPSSSTSGAPGG